MLPPCSVLVVQGYQQHAGAFHMGYTRDRNYICPYGTKSLFRTPLRMPKAYGYILPDGERETVQKKVCSRISTLMSAMMLSFLRFFFMQWNLYGAIMLCHVFTMMQQGSELKRHARKAMLNGRACHVLTGRLNLRWTISWWWSSCLFHGRAGQF